MLANIFSRRLKQSAFSLRFNLVYSLSVAPRVDSQAWVRKQTRTQVAVTAPRVKTGRKYRVTRREALTLTKNQSTWKRILANYGGTRT